MTTTGRRPLRTTATRVLTVLVMGVALLTADPAVGGAPVRLGDVDDPVSASVAISQATFGDGAAGVVVGRADLFPDDLAGAPLAGADRPLLLVPGGEDGVLPPLVADEIARLLSPDPGCAGGTQVDLLGGAPAVSVGIEQALRDAGWCVDRHGGASRVETSVAIAEVVRARPGADLHTVAVARADDWADAATGGAWAAANGTPVVVTGSDALHPAVVDALTRWQVQRIVLLGGTAALSEELALEAAAYAPQVQRVAGAERNATAAAIAGELWGAFDEVLVLNGRDPQAWAWALTAAVPAARRGAPQLYTEVDELPAVTAALVDRVGSATVVGPERLVSAAVAARVAGGPGGPPPGEPGGLVPADTAVLRGTDDVAALNFYLEQAGLPLVTSVDPELQQGAFEHSRYTVEESHPGHEEDPASPWSTPASRGEPFERNYLENWFGDDAGLTGVHALNVWMRTPFHASAVVAPGVTAYALGVYENPAKPYPTAAATFRAVGEAPDAGGSAFLGTYPADGRTLASTAFWEGGEIPDPLGPCGYTQPAGAPIHVQIPPFDPLPSAVSSTLTGPDGVVPHCWFTGFGAIHILPRDPLAPGTTYEASITADGETIAWSFVTALDPV